MNGFPTTLQLREGSPSTAALSYPELFTELAIRECVAGAYSPISTRFEPVYIRGPSSGRSQESCSRSLQCLGSEMSIRVLNVAEKPSVAKEISSILAGRGAAPSKVRATTPFRTSSLSRNSLVASFSRRSAQMFRCAFSRKCFSASSFRACRHQISPLLPSKLVLILFFFSYVRFTANGTRQNESRLGVWLQHWKLQL